MVERLGCHGRESDPAGHFGLAVHRDGRWGRGAGRHPGTRTTPLWYAMHDYRTVIDRLLYRSVNYTIIIVYIGQIFIGMP